MGGAGVMMGNIHRNKKHTHAGMRHSGSTPYGWQDTYTHTLIRVRTDSQATDGQCAMSVLYVPQCGLIKTQRRRAKLAVSGTFAPSSDAWNAAVLNVLYLGCKITTFLALIVLDAYEHWKPQWVPLSLRNPYEKISKCAGFIENSCDHFGKDGKNVDL